MVRARARGGCEADRGRPACVFMCNEVAPEARGLQIRLPGWAAAPRLGRAAKVAKCKNEKNENDKK